MTGARAVADLEEGLILARVDIAAPIERVFKALTDPAELTKWWGVEGQYRTTHAEADLREGGAWRSSGVSADGSEFTVVGAYRRVEPPHHIEFTWNPSWDSGETVVSYRLSALPDGGTRLTLRHSGFGDRVGAYADHANGWERVLAILSGYLKPDRPSWVLRLIPPRQSFAFDMTAEERDVMLAHSAYWRGRLANGDAVAFGPVNDASGSYGLGLLRAADEAAVLAFERDDPAILSGRGFSYHHAPMLALVTA